MTPQEITERLLEQYEKPRFEQIVQELQPLMTVELIAHLKKRVDEEKLKDAHLALRMATLAQSLVPYINEPEAEALAYWAKGTALRHLLRYQEALKCYQKAMAIYASLGQQLDLVGVQVPMVSALRVLGDHHAALTLAKKARMTCLALGTPAQPYLGSLEMNVGVIYKQLGNPEAALQAYQRGRTIFQKLGNAIQAARIDINRSNVLQDMSRFLAAQELLQGARQTLAQTGQYASQVAHVDFNLGMLAHRRGRYQEALTHFEAARQGGAGLESFIAMVDLRRCLIYRQLNLITETINLAVAAEPILVASGMLKEQALALYQQGMGYQLSGAFSLAESHLMKARQLLQQQDVRAILFELDYDLAYLAYITGRLNDARKLAQRLSQQITSDTWPLLAAQVRLLLAQCVRQKEPDKARHYVQAALKLASDYSLREPTIAAHHLMGQILESKGQLLAAWSQYQTAMQQIESLRALLLVDQFRIGFMDNKLPIYADAVRLSQRIGSSAQVLSVLNLAHTAPLSPLATEPADESLQSELAALREEWHWHQNKLEKAHSAQEPTAIIATLRQVEAKLADLTHRWHLHQTSPSPRRVIAPQLWSSDGANQFLSSIQQCLGPNEVLLHYYLVNETFQALRVTKNAIHLLPNLTPVKPLARILRGWNRHLTQIDFINQSSFKSLAQRYLASFYETLVAPLRPDLAPDSDLFVVMPPDWHNLPLAAFFDGQHYLVERHQITYLSAPEVLLSAPAPYPLIPESKPQALLVGHSDGGRLKGTLQAAQTVAANLPASWQATLLMDATATFDNFQRASRNSHLIHLATHATFRADNPLFSWARLAEHRLTVAELYQMKLPQKPLVVLSACETGQGKARGGGLLGMGRALLTAGASGLVVTLWRVEDLATAQFMIDFYDPLMSEHNQQMTAVAAALRHAQLKAIARHQHPFFWAGFIFIQA